MTMTDKICRVIGLVGIITIELYALSQHVDGIAISVSVGAIAGILGIKFGEQIRNKEIKNGQKNN